VSDGIRDRLQAALLDAMKSRDKIAVNAFRSALSAIANSEAIEAERSRAMLEGPIAGSRRGLGAGDAPRRFLTELDMLDIVDREIEELVSDAARYDTVGQTAPADELRDQIPALEAILAR
jgi:hypothetical protein